MSSEDTALAKDGSVNDETQVQQLVHDLFDEANCDSAGVCDLYEKLVKQKSVNLKEYIQDDRHARALFISLFTHVANSKRHDLVSSLLADMHQMSISRNLCFYASVMKVYSKKNMHQEALKMYDFVVLDKLKPDSSMCICLMNSAIACNELDKAHQFFSELCRSETPSLRIYMAMLRTYQKANNWEAAVDILQIMRDTGVVPNNLVFNNVLGICISASQVGVAADLLDTWKDTPDLVDVISYNTVLKGYAHQVNVDECEVLLTRMQNHGVIPNLISFNTVMDCAVRAMHLVAKQHGGRHPRNIHRESEDEGGSLSFAVDFPAISSKPWEILRRMEALGLAPDICTCSTLVKGMHLSGCNAREIDKAMKLLKAVGPEALKSNDSKNAHQCEVLFNSMLDVCVNVKDLNRMGQVFAMMRECQVAVTAATFGILIKAFGQARRLDRIVEVWAEMRRVKVRPTAVTYGCCIDACIQNGDIDTAMTVFEEMKPDGCVPNAVIYTSLIRGFACANLPERALALYKDMRLQGIKCNSATVNLVADQIARQASDDMTMAHIIDDMLACQVQPDIMTYSILIKANCAMRNLQNAMSLFENLKEKGLALDEITFNVLLNECSKNFRMDHAETVFAYMRVLGVRPSNITLSILVKLYGKAKMLDKAIEIMSIIEHDYKLEPNLFVYTCLIQACVQNRQVDRGWNVFRSMQKKGIEPDAITYGTLIHGCLYTNKFDLAMTIVNQVYNVQCNDSSKDSITNLIHNRKPSSKTCETLCLQPEVLNSLLLALNRKGKIDQAAQLECLMNANNIAINPRAQRSKPAYASCAKDVKHDAI